MQTQSRLNLFLYGLMVHLHAFKAPGPGGGACGARPQIGAPPGDLDGLVSIQAPVRHTGEVLPVPPGLASARSMRAMSYTCRMDPVACSQSLKLAWIAAMSSLRPASASSAGVDE